MHSIATVFLVCTFLVVLAPSRVAAFGAGDIPDFSYLNDKAFRHGDIESILETLAKTVGGAAAGDGLLGFASAVLSGAKGGEKFSKLDIKRVYFGNWLRDYSQAMDIAGLSKLSADTIVMIISILGFMTFGFATEEFEVTPDRLAVYLPVEHIDNPKGYAQKEGDAREFHPELRPPVDPRELEVDESTGMKKYMATEHEGWDTSTACIRRTFKKCIEHGRRARGSECDDLWEAYRLLGTGLHTLEDLLAHSNWCEIALRKMGHEEVFCHVGDEVIVETPSGTAPPLVTGTFGSADFIHSLMGEATDHISEASVTNLYDKMKQSGDSNTSMESLKTILSKLPIGGGSEKAEEAENIRRKAYDFDPDKYAPKEVQEQLLSVLKWRDGVYRDIIKKLEMIPGLTDLIDQLTNALNAYIYTVLAPWLTPILQQATSALSEGSKAVIDSDDQYEVFDNPSASNPSHSILSKDHFGLILNEPAGKIAQTVVANSVNLIVKAWSSDDDAGRVVEEILEAFHHPYYASRNSQIQTAMMDQMERWFGGLGGDEGRQTIAALTKDSVRNGKNKRLGSAVMSGEPGATPSYSQHQTQDSDYESPQTHGGYMSETIGYAGRQSQSQYSSNISSYSRRNEDYSYSQPQETYRDGGRQDNGGSGRQSYGGDDSYSRQNESSYGLQESDGGYGDRGRYGTTETRSYSSRNEDPASYSYGRHAETPSYESSGAIYNRQSVGESEGRGHHGGHHGRYHHQEQEEFRQEGYQPSYVQPGRNGDYGDDGPPEVGGFGLPMHHRQGPRPGEGEGYGREDTFGAERLNLEDRDGGYGDGHRAPYY